MKRSNHFSCQGKSSPRQLGYCGYVITVTHLYWVDLNLTLWIKNPCSRYDLSWVQAQWGNTDWESPIHLSMWSRSHGKSLFSSTWIWSNDTISHIQNFCTYTLLFYANKLIQVLGLDGCIQSPNVAILPTLGQSQIWIAATLYASMLIL